MSERGLHLDVILLAVFVTLKLTDLVHWSWVWVLAPLWMPIGVLGTLQVFAMACEIVGTYLQRRARRRAGLP